MPEERARVNQGEETHETASLINTLLQTPMLKVKLSLIGGNDAKLGEIKHHVFMVKLADEVRLYYRAFCGGSIITDIRVLTSTHCFFTNRKRLKHARSKVKVVGGMLTTFVQQPEHDDVQQWRSIERMFTQKFYRFPAYNLAIVQLDKAWVFNQFVNKISFASINQDFDGVCSVTAVQPTRSWSKQKYLFSQAFPMLSNGACESTLLRDCELYYCTDFDHRKVLLQSIANEGSGLVCHGTGDPMETDETKGLLVGVTSLIHVYLPTLHHRVGSFHDWIVDSCDQSADTTTAVLILCLVIKFLV